MSDLFDQTENDLMRRRLRFLGFIDMRSSFDRQFSQSVSKRDPATLTKHQTHVVMSLLHKYRRAFPPHLRLPSDPSRSIEK